MSRRKRTSDRHLTSIVEMDEARKMISEGHSIRSVARSLNMHEATLRKRLKRVTPANTLGRYGTTFTTEMEKELVNYIQQIDSMYYGLTAKGLRELAYQFADMSKIPHRFNNGKKIAGKDWLRGFCRRHPEIALRQPTSTSIARAVGFNKPQCDRFFSNLTELMQKYGFPPHAIYNMDETGISTVPNKTQKVFSTKGKRCVNKISSAERGVNVTLVCAVSASGQFIPPAFIFARKRMKAELLDSAPPSSIGLVSDSSFINSELFLDWLSHFKDHARPSAESPVLLILDNHTTHCSLQAIEFFRKHHIHALTLPPHSSHKTQPLDRCFFNVLKKFYAAECEKWMRNHPGRSITVYQIAAILTPAYLRAATPKSAVEGFRTTGIWPLNPDIFNEADFLPTAVTERSNPDTSGNESIANTSLPSTSQAVLLNDESGSRSGFREAGTSLRFLEIATPSSSQGPERSPSVCLASSSKNPDTGVSSPSSASIFEVAPLPKAASTLRSNRKKKKSAIISGSPYKNEMERQLAIKTTPKSKRLKQNPKRKKWSCPGCQEAYEEPITEDWIECSRCKNWWHEKCSNYSNVGCYICDFCTK